MPSSPRAASLFTLANQIARHDMAALRRSLLRLPDDTRIQTINQVDGQGYALLAHAFKAQDFKLALWLLDNGADPHGTVHGRSMWNGYAQARWTQPDQSNRYPLDVAMADLVFERLLAARVGISGNPRGWTAVHLLVSASSCEDAYPAAIDQLDQLRQAGYDMDAHDDIDETPLMVALWDLNVPIARWLLQHGARVDGATIGGCTVAGYTIKSTSKAEKENCGPRIVELLSMIHEAGAQMFSSRDQKDLDRWREIPGALKAPHGIIHSIDLFQAGLQQQSKLDAQTSLAPSARSIRPRM
jgi:hypothetical protein